jgi:hypothetical protein
MIIETGGKTTGGVIVTRAVNGAVGEIPSEVVSRPVVVMAGITVTVTTGETTGEKVAALTQSL